MEVYNDELKHFGVVGMKWGRRKTYGSMPRMLTAKRQLAADKFTLNKINNGNHHVSVGLTKKRQEALDKRDKRIIEKRIAKNTIKVNKNKNNAIKTARNDLKTTMINYQKAKSDYMNSDSSKESKIYKEAEKKFMDTQKLAMEKTTGEKAAKIVGTTIALIGGMTLSAYAASKK